MKLIIDQLGKKVYNSIWKKADDVTTSMVYLGELYDKVPEHLKMVKVYEMTIHTVDKEHVEEVLRFLDDEEK